MNYTKIAAIFADGEQLSGQTVTVGGWARTIRDMKTFGFIELNDGSCFRSIQLTIDSEKLADRDTLAALKEAGTGASLEAYGTLVVSPAKGQSAEIEVKRLVLLGRGQIGGAGAQPEIANHQAADDHQGQPVLAQHAL